MLLSAILVGAFLSVSCAKEDPVDLSLRFGKWYVSQSTDPSAGGSNPVPGDTGFFLSGDKVEFKAKKGTTEELVLTRNITLNGVPVPLDFDFFCRLDGNKPTLQEQEYGGPPSTLTYEIQILDSTAPKMKRVDLGSGQGLVTMSRQ